MPIAPIASTTSSSALELAQIAVTAFAALVAALAAASALRSFSLSRGIAREQRSLHDAKLLEQALSMVRQVRDGYTAWRWMQEFQHHAIEADSEGKDGWRSSVAALQHAERTQQDLRDHMRSLPHVEYPAVAALAVARLFDTDEQDVHQQIDAARYELYAAIRLEYLNKV